VITNFFFNPTRENFDVIGQRSRYYSNTDGNRGRAADDVLYCTVQSFNVALSDALLDPTRLAAQR
jgi:hypothetical protein